MGAIDAHVHVQPWRMVKPDRLALMTRGRTDLERVKRCMDEPAEFLRLLDEAGVEAAVLVNYVAPEVMGFIPEVNEWIAGYCRADPRRLVPMGSVHPLHQPEPGREVERLAALGIRALKVHPPHQLFAPNAYRTGELPALGEVYGAAERLGLPVMFHTGTSIFPGARNVHADPMPVDDVAVDFPRLTIVLAHAGRPLHVETAVFLARRHPNVWLDISSIPPSRLLHYLPRLEELAGKTLFGTDWPAPGVPSIRENLEAVAALPLGEAAKAKLLRENARAVYRL
ncbi:MAG: amidohydrolase family protein [Planctomycetales bacterium]|nr:amidohydrolase family protein [Planctomycetales bacterium]